jgi:purine-nucleoside phosphorylase
LEPNLKSCSPKVEIGSTWTTDAPFRETASAIDACRNMGLVAAEMEAAALYAFSRAQNKPIICFAHVTNQMASIEGDFEKGAENGSRDALRLVVTVAQLWQSLSKQQFNKPVKV